MNLMNLEVKITTDSPHDWQEFADAIMDAVWFVDEHALLTVQLK